MCELNLFSISTNCLNSVISINIFFYRFIKGILKPWNFSFSKKGLITHICKI